MASLVDEQGEVAARIDADMDAVTDNVAAGHTELHTFYESAAANRGLILKVFAVVALVLVLFALLR